jgi:uncharacterized protein (AIM24 family)
MQHRSPNSAPFPADAQFEVLGTPSSLLSASLSASQRLYTRRGTLVGLSGKAENTVSTLSLLSPLSRLPLGIPFFYQRIESATPITALLSTRSPSTSFAVVHLNGTLDWTIAQRSALLAWTGQTLSITPRANFALSIANWGHSRVTGRGLLALVGRGQIYHISLKAGESYIAHPANTLAYSLSPHSPSPYRLTSSSLRFSVPGQGWLASLLPDTKFIRTMRATPTWRTISRVGFAVRTWARKSIWGDRLFLRFEGPTTILLQSRAARVSDVLTGRELDEICDSSAEGSARVSEVLGKDAGEQGGVVGKGGVGEGPLQVKTEVRRPVMDPNGMTPPKMSYATVGGDGRVTFEKAK